MGRHGRRIPLPAASRQTNPACRRDATALPWRRVRDPLGWGPGTGEAATFPRAPARFSLVLERAGSRVGRRPIAESDAQRP